MVSIAVRMKSLTALIVFSLNTCCILQAQNQEAQPALDPALKSKLTVAGFCLCQTTKTECPSLQLILGKNQY